MSQNAARQLEAFAIGDDAWHPEYGDGEVLGYYGANKLSVRFVLPFGVKRLPIEAVLHDSPDGGLAILRREIALDPHPSWLDADVAEADAMMADLYRTPIRETATIIPFPCHRIIRRVSHGRGIVVSSDKLAALASDASVTVLYPARPA